MANTTSPHISIIIPEKFLPMMHRDTEEITIGYEEYILTKMSKTKNVYVTAHLSKLNLRQGFMHMI